MIYMIKKVPSFKRHETFSIREGWLEKALHKIHDNPRCFANNEGSRNFGLGTNMVKSLRFWLQVTGICEFSTKTGATLTNFGETLYAVDEYLENDLSWWLIHYNLVQNELENPVFYNFFHNEQQTFEKDSYTNYLFDYYHEKYDVGTLSLIEADVSVLFKTYITSPVTDPENNLNSPLGKLGLLITNNDKQYIKEHPLHSKLNKMAIYFVLVQYAGYEKLREFNLDDLLASSYSPILLFNLTKSSLFAYLDELRNDSLINVIKTAGLNTIKINQILTIKELYSGER